MRSLHYNIYVLWLNIHIDLGCKKSECAVMSLKMQMVFCCCCCRNSVPWFFWRTFFIVTSLLVTTTFCFTLTLYAFIFSILLQCSKQNDSTWMLFVCETTMYHVFKRIIGVDLLLDITQRVTKKGLFFRIPCLTLLNMTYCWNFIAFVSFRLHGWAYTPAAHHTSQKSL